jgi:uncharacterized protein (TIGR00297 family)
VIGAPHFVGFLLAAAGAAIVLATGQGTMASALVGFGVACLLVLGFGVPVMAPLSTFVLGSGILTRLGRRLKERSGSAEANRGRRTASQVLAKLAIPALLGLVAALAGDGTGWLAIAATASLAGAFADTTATEIGPLGQGAVVRWSGLRLERTSHGSVGGMSVAGLVAGAGASILVAVVAWTVGLVRSPAAAGVVAFAGFAATGIESAVAATPAGVRLGHGGRNVLVSASAAAVAAVVTWGGIR